jgi:hypothetical protein
VYVDVYEREHVSPMEFLFFFLIKFIVLECPENKVKYLDILERICRRILRHFGYKLGYIHSEMYI